MNTHRSVGGCYCGNITFEMVLTRAPASINPRACDCDFCRKQGAAYISDKRGKLVVSVKNEGNLGRYQQGSGIADFLMCKECGVLIGACHENQGLLYAAINSKTVDKSTRFGQELVASPKEQNDSEKIKRWLDIWFSDVELRM